MKWYITGDTHSDFSRFSDYEKLKKDIAVIICGDASVNYYLGKKDRRLKGALRDVLPKVTFYLVRGNHEARPESLITMKQMYDMNVKGNVWIEEDYPNIRYFQDGEVYDIGGKRTLVLGGAYSVDKEHRLINNWPWFPTEQLSLREREAITEKYAGQHFDLILSHTCPYPWQPFDKFISFIDQNKVDNSMEFWLEDLSHKVSYNLWIFGHFHDDRTINYFSQMVFEEIYDLNKLFKKFKRKQKRLSR
jgi:3-oxoacid CoA-transferase subunit A